MSRPENDNDDLPDETRWDLAELDVLHSGCWTALNKAAAVVRILVVGSGPPQFTSKRQ